jgi:uncharacterized protein (DUF885 family)
MQPGGKHTIESVAFHEGAPGHHLQLSLVRGLAAHPVVRSKSVRASDAIALSVDRRVALLGQGLAYEIGESEILSLREHAKQELGSKFDLREFHTRVLEDGFVTLPMLREKIRRWIESTR